MIPYQIKYIKWYNYPQFYIIKIIIIIIFRIHKKKKKKYNELMCTSKKKIFMKYIVYRLHLGLLWTRYDVNEFKS